MEELREIRPERRRNALIEGTLACPACDLPVAPPGGRAPLHADVACPTAVAPAPCATSSPFELPTRPARVVVTVRQPPPVPVTRRAPT